MCKWLYICPIGCRDIEENCKNKVAQSNQVKKVIRIPKCYKDDVWIGKTEKKSFLLKIG